MSESPHPTSPREESSLPTPGDDAGRPKSDADAERFDRDLSAEEAEALSEMSVFDLADTTEAPQRSQSPGDDEVVQAKVVQVHGDDVFIDVGGKAEGVVPRSQFSDKEVPAPGQTIEVFFDHFDAGSQIQVYSRKGAARVAMWENMAPGVLVEGRIVGMNKGGLELNLKGIRGFMPASHVDIDRLRDISVFLGETVTCEVLEVDRRAKNLLLSRRKVQEKERAAARETLLADLEEGQVRKGVVRNLADYGAFVDLGGVDGLLHISDMSWSQVDKPSDIVSVGQEIEVKVLKIDRERDRISLGYKQARPDPWSGVEEKYPVGTQLSVRIVRLADFGAFAEVEEGVEALIPLSEMSWERIGKPGRLVSEGQVVEVAVIRVELEKRRMALSMKQATPDPWAGIEDEFPKDLTVTGTVTKVADFGAFVQLRPGVEGLVHVSELSDQHVRRPSDVVKPGQDLTVKVLDVNTEQRRISLSVKATQVAESAEGTERAEAKRPAKKRQKPRRGGLSADGGGMFDGLLG